MAYKSMQFMPGNNPGMLLSSSILGADAVIIDLEDAVNTTEKDAARMLVREYLLQFKPTNDIFIRINPLDSPYFYDDIDAIIDLGVTGIMLPKADVESVKELHRVLDEKKSEFEIFGLIETAMGLEESLQILGASDKITGVLLGAEDLTLDLGAERTKASEEIRYARSKIVAVSKALQIQAIDTPFTDTDDIEGLKLDAEKAKAMGMTGKSSISPRHIDTINGVFAPSEEEVNHAIRVCEGAIDAKEKGLGAWSLDGKMVDAPIIKRAMNTLISSGDFKEEYNGLLG
ncbi:MAG: CoA ester lyase [Tissierellia bacterium]|nr:CoA ester lyase [Tissierellia bacterium]